MEAHLRPRDSGPSPRSRHPLRGVRQARGGPAGSAPAVIGNHERRLVAAYAAPRLRARKPRKFYVTRDGVVVRETTSTEVSMSILAAEAIAFDVEPAEDSVRCAMHVNGVRCPSRATPVSLANSRDHRCRAYCLEHRNGRCPTAPCSLCGKPSTRTSHTSALAHGNRPYCSEHRGGRTAKADRRCAECDVDITNLPWGRSRCDAHAKGRRATITCWICGSPADNRKANAARYRHKVAGKPVRATCGDSACSVEARRRANDERRRTPVYVCAVCGEPATRVSSRSRLVRGTNAYCCKHRRGKTE